MLCSFYIICSSFHFSKQLIINSYWCGGELPNEPIINPRQLLSNRVLRWVCSRFESTVMLPILVSYWVDSAANPDQPLSQHPIRQLSSQHRLKSVANPDQLSRPIRVSHRVISWSESTAAYLRTVESASIPRTVEWASNIGVNSRVFWLENGYPN